MAEYLTTPIESDMLDIREPAQDAGEIVFRIVKRRFVDSYVTCDVARGRRSWFLENLLIEIADAGPEGAQEVAARRGYRFAEGPRFIPAKRGLVEVSGLLQQVDVVQIPSPADPALR